MIQMLVDWLGYSFRKVTMLTVKGFSQIGYKTFNVVNYYFPLNIRSEKSIVIGDTVTAFLHASRYRLPKVYWVDSPLVVTEREMSALDGCLYTTLPYWCRYYNDVGLKCHGYIPRPVDVETSESVLNADCGDIHKMYGDYVVMVGADQTLMPPKKPRKGLDIFDAVCEWIRTRNIRCVAVTNWSLKNSIVIRSGSLSEYELLRLIKCAKLFLFTSRSEGFGMPPVEAMAVKQLVVTSNAPLFDHIVGIKFDYSEEIYEYMPEAGRHYIGWDINPKNVIEAVDYALSLSSDDRDAIVEKAYMASKAYSPFRIALALSEVYI